MVPFGQFHNPVPGSREVEGRHAATLSHRSCSWAGVVQQNRRKGSAAIAIPVLYLLLDDAVCLILASDFLTFGYIWLSTKLSS